MKFKCGESLLLALFMLFIELIKRCFSLPKSIEMVDPLIIKINPEKFENISFIIFLDEATEGRTGKKIRLQQETDKNFNQEIISKEENEQDKSNKEKIEFNFIQKRFRDHYGKFNLSYQDNADSNWIYYNQTIFIYMNDITLKNPKNKYFITGNQHVKARYDFSLPIAKDEINSIKFYEVSNPEKKENLSKINYTIENEMKLALDFPRQNSPSTYIFDIYPEYDKDTSIIEIQRFYLYFQDYLLNNDAIYINKNNYTNEVPFILSFRYEFNFNLLSIKDYSFKSTLLSNKNYEITINLGRKTSPGKIEISYNGQKRELFYILYSSNFQRCYDKEEPGQLEITMEWIDEMEYDHRLYFNDTTTKLLTPLYVGKSGTTVTYKYKYSTLSLNSGLFSLKSTIVALNYSLSYNPVDNKHLYLYIYSNGEIFDRNHTTIFSNNNTEQIIYISSSEPDAVTVFDEIILRKDDNKTEILVSKSTNECYINKNNNQFYCDLKDKIINPGNVNITGNYFIIYKSKCGKNLTIEGKVVTIRKGIGLSDISPRWVNKSDAYKKEIILTYDDDLTSRNLEICFNKKKESDNECDYKVENSAFRRNKEKVIVSLGNIEEGRYFVRTIIKNEDIDFVTKDKSFKVSDPRINFTFNHHYFVINDNPENKLKITVEDTEEQFGCRIVENIENKTLNNGSDDCTIFEYKIEKPGTFRFNYSDNEEFMIPINDSIVVVSNYPQFFTFNEKFCYYYLFNISIDILNSYKSKLKIKVFLKDRYNYDFLLNNIDNKYTYIDDNDTNISLFDPQGFDLYISEERIDPIVYLYKSNIKVKFTEIETPEFIIDPNKTIVFSNVNCDLNSSIFKIIKMDEPEIQNYLTYWKYDKINSYLFFNITGDFYKANRFRYYYYQIDYNSISNINDENELYKTFASRRLNETNFDLKKADSNDYVTITNKEKDFYFPLILGLNTIQEYRIPKNKTSDREELEINNDESTIKFKYLLAINDVLRINYLERKVYDEWEERQNLGSSMYYFFKKDNIINGSSLAISPKLFAFNIPKQEEYIITILYSEEKQKSYWKSNLTNCTNSTDNLLEQNCNINFKIQSKTAQSIIINIADNFTNSYEKIDFVYYELDDNSKKCQTMNNTIMNNLTLLVNIPSPDLKDKIKLYSPDTDIIGGKNETNRMLFILNGTTINLQKTYLRLYTDDEELDHWFTLQDLGINILPKYKIRFNNNENISYLLPEANQVVKVTISVENNEIINMNDISGFIIRGENNKNLEYKVLSYPINGEQYALNLNFNLSSVDQSEKNYSLYYIDRCEKEIQTDLKVSLVTFNFKRKYFVLNNNKNLKYQILIIEGPVDDKISISVYKNGEYNGDALKNILNIPKYYYLNFSQSSQGNYTFKVVNDRIESNINEIIYVRENLGEILSLKQNISDCMFSNSNKSSIKDFSYTITPSNLNTNFENFQSYYSPNQKDFINFTSSGDIKEKTFSLAYTTEMKSEINLDNKLYIYLTENNDKDQPIYVFNYRYTNIELHPDFAKFIYTDADYILFKMNCKINNMKNFDINNINGNAYSIACENREVNDIYNEETKIFKCYLSSNAHDKNRLLDFGTIITEYHNYNIKYEQIQITNESLFFSQDIYKANFVIETPSQIERNVNITINMTTPRTFFYFSEVEKVTYKKFGEDEKNMDFKYNSNNYISMNLFIENQTNYTINKICRKSCSYCKKSEPYIVEEDCQILKGEPIIKTNTPDVYFTFDKHYIALEDSSYKNKEKDGTISILTITIKGENENEIQELIYYKHTTSTNIEGPNYINRQNNQFQLNLSKGKYTFQYRYRLNNKIYTIRDIVLVTTYDYEMFDFSDFSSHCVFYDLSIPGLLVSINPNPSYEFKNDITLAYLFLELGKVSLPYNGGKGYKIGDLSLFDNNNNYFDIIYLRESNVPETNFVFTTLYNITSNTIDKRTENKFDFYYKDNIILEQQNCKSNNIYIRSITNPSESFSLLKCNYSDSNQFQYCDTDYKFSYKTNDNFNLYFGINKLNSSFILNIYNSIKDSNFNLYYIKPTIYIQSTNFDMDKINSFILDNNNITNFNKPSDSNSITYEYIVDNSTEHYVKELWRKHHDYDRNSTIKNKKVNLKIEKRQCPEFMVEVLSESGSYCISCSQKALAPGESGLNIWYQNGECVPFCFGDFYIYDNVNHYCLNCTERTTINGQTVCGCLVGTVKSPLDGVCYLPEDPEIKRASLIRSNVQCYRIDGKTDNYCKNETTSKCEIVSYSGSDFPICHCKDGYTGKYCETEINEINLNDYLDSILNENINDKIDESNPGTIAKIRGIIYFIERDNTYSSNIDINKINSFLKDSINCIKDAINEKHNYTQIYDVIEITVHFLVYKIQNSKRLRLLDEDGENRNNLKFVLENAHYLNYLANKNYTGSNYNIQGDILNLISFISYRPDAIDSSFRTYIKNMTSNSSIVGYTNLRNNKVNDEGENVMAVLTIFNRKILYLNSSEDGLIFNFSISNNSISLADLKDFYIYFYSQNMKVNFELANYYQARNINIYDKYDPCFTDACFTSKNFEYDLTQKYRKKNVFQKWSLDNEICRYHSFENASNNIEISCQKFEDFGQMNDSYNYATLDLIVKKDYVNNQDKVYNLPLKCKKKMKSENYAFWIFFIICILEIIYIIGITILTLGSLRRISIRKGLRNDGLFYIIPRIENSDDDLTSKHGNPLNNKKDEYYNSVNDIVEKPRGSYNKTLLESLLSNFKELHPLLVLCRASIISPLIMNSWFLVFNILSLFGFNALIYYEGLIEKRIYNKKRHYFDYPMRKEFHKILLSILLQIALTAIIKLIVIVSLKQYENLETKLSKCKMKGEEINNDIIVRHDDFQDEMFIRRLIGGFLMTIIIIFFFYYNVVFCEVYINTQRNLVFGWIWSLFWEWVIFAPIYIVVISFLEHKKANSKDPLVYYLKRLFFF